MFVTESTDRQHENDEFTSVMGMTTLVPRTGVNNNPLLYSPMVMSFSWNVGLEFS